MNATDEGCRRSEFKSTSQTRGVRQNWKELTRFLVDIVSANYEKAQPAWSQSGHALPEDFQHVLIVRDDDPWWWSPTAGGISLSQIPMLLASCITAKDTKLPAYRKNLPDSAEVWLLFHSGVTVARSVEVPHGINEWRFPFEFDRVFCGCHFSDLSSLKYAVLREWITRSRGLASSSSVSVERDALLMSSWTTVSSAVTPISIRAGRRNSTIFRVG